MKILLSAVSLFGIGILIAMLLNPRKNALSDFNAYRMSCDAVQASLKSPATAVFPSASTAGYIRESDRTIVSSYVDSQNAFGAIVRTDWIVWVKKTGIRYTSAEVVGLESRK